MVNRPQGESYDMSYTCEVNNYIVRSYRDVIVVTNTTTRRTIKASRIAMY